MFKILIGTLILFSLSSQAAVKLPIECKYDSGNDNFKDMTIVFNNTANENQVEVTTDNKDEVTTKTFTSKKINDDEISVFGKTKKYGLSFAFEYKVTNKKATLIMLGGKLTAVFNCRPISL